MNSIDEEQRLETWSLFLQTHARLTQLLEQELERDAGLPLTWYDVLAQLSAAPEHRLRMSDLFHSLVMSKSGLTRRIDRMEAAGLVSREGCPADRRGVYAVLTPAGRAALLEAAPIHLRGIQEHFGRHLTEADTAGLQHCFEKVLSNLGADQAQCCDHNIEASA